MVQAFTELESSTTPTLQNAPLRLPCETRVLGGRYRVRRLLGRGGMANVFLGDDLVLERAVAIKLLHPHLAEDSSGLERFRREAMTLAAIRSPHVVGIYDIGLDEEGVYLVMQHVEGRTIEQEIARTGAMANARVEAVVTQLLDGLAEVHAQGLVHRDIKPSNVLLDESGHVVLLDLGIVLDTRRAPLTAPGMVAGTPGYLAPESSTRAESDYSSDVYQVGLLMLHLLTGVELARRCPMNGFDDLVQKLPASLGGVVRRALAADPSERFPSAEMMKEAVETALACSEVTTQPKPERARTNRGEHRPLASDRVSAAPELRANLVVPGAQVPTKIAPALVPRVAPLVRTIKTTALQAAQILSVRHAGEDPAADYGASHPTSTRIPIMKPQALTRGRILIVDEDVAFCGTLHRMLNATHDVLVVHTATQALSCFDGGARVDVILCGLASPMTFHEALLRRHPEQATSMIFLTGRGSTKEARAFVAKASSKNLSKPFEITLLKQLIDGHLASRSGNALLT
jgi:tRNA A-37 threonylcarbamoyl transferase component Bud32